MRASCSAAPAPLARAIPPLITCKTRRITAQASYMCRRLISKRASLIDARARADRVNKIINSKVGLIVCARKEVRAPDVARICPRARWTKARLKWLNASRPASQTNIHTHDILMNMPINQNEAAKVSSARAHLSKRRRRRRRRDLR